MTTNQFSLQDAGNSYSWIWEGIDESDFLAWTDEDIESALDLHISIARENYEIEVKESAESKSYPCFGATTGDILNDEDEYVAYILADLEEEITSERESATEAIKAHQAEIRTERALENVMTAAEAQDEYGLSESAVRLACQRGSIPARKSGGTWLILRKHAELRWGDRLKHPESDGFAPAGDEYDQYGDNADRVRRGYINPID